MIRLLFAIAVALMALTVAASAPADQDCTWGASSVLVVPDANGNLQQSEPVTTGCIP